MAYTMLDNTAIRQRNYAPYTLEGAALSFIRECCEGLRFDKNKWRKKIDDLLKKQNMEKCDKIMSFMGVKLQKEIFPKKIYDDLVDYEFEDIYMKGPVEYDKVLSQLYGDYMSLPPKEKRISHPMEILIDRK